MTITRVLGIGRPMLMGRASPGASAVRRMIRYSASVERLYTTSGIQVESVPAASQDILNAQRLKRPSSPHFTIYQPQITWVASIANRVTGVGLSVGLYGFLIAYLAVPVTGIPMDSSHIVEFAHGAPEWLKYTAKGIVALPFTFHSLNGIRHLAWDLVKGTSVRTVYRTGYSVIGLSVISAIALVML